MCLSVLSTTECVVKDRRTWSALGLCTFSGNWQKTSRLQEHTHACTWTPALCPLTAFSFIRGRMDQRRGQGAEDRGLQSYFPHQRRWLILGQDDLRCCLCADLRVDGHTGVQCLTGLLWVPVFPPETTKDTDTHTLHWNPGARCDPSLIGLASCFPHSEALDTCLFHTSDPTHSFTHEHMHKQHFKFRWQRTNSLLFRCV